ncbi:MAG: hypothetical protein JWN78_1348 [Bacteroidota bacterium]|nr:hypothetical protein [Bacteroidota bacterium]
MKRIISLLLLTGLLTYSVSNVQAGTVPITSTNLSPALKSIIENVKKECGLNPTQTTKFTNDYVTFLNENAKPNADTRKLLFDAGGSFRSYLNDGQFTKLMEMIKAGKLDPAKAAGSVTPSKAAAPPQKYTETALPKTIYVQSHVASLFKQLTPFMNVTQEQSTKATPILQEYDRRITGIKNNGGNFQAPLDALNAETASKLKAILNDDQMAKLVLAVQMQENILLGTNLSPSQKEFLSKLRTQYNLNDVQTMAVILVMVQGKVRGDAINQMAKTNPQGAAQELGKLMQDLDVQLKSSLSADQYAKLKSDIEKLIKGQKL